MDQKLQYKRGSLGRKMKVLISDAVAIEEGYPICFNSDYGTAASVDMERFYQAEKPSTSNNYFFAGVAAESRPVGTVGTQELSIWLPGSICLVYTNQNCTINSTVITAEAGQWRFGQAGFRGVGSALAMQTVNRSSTPGTVLAWLDDGEQSGLIEVLTATAGGATAVMVGGVTHYATATPATNATSTLGAGTFIGQRKAFILAGAQTTGDIVITVTTPEPIGGAGFTATGLAVYNTFTMDEVAEHLMATWNGKAWKCSGTVGTAV